MLPADDLADDAYTVIRDALKETDKFGLGQLTMRGNEHLVAVGPRGKGLVLHALRYAEEVRDAKPYFSSLGDAEGDPGAVDIAAQLMLKLVKPFNLEDWADHYEAGLQKLVATKVAARTKEVAKMADSVEAPRPAATNVIDLMRSLKAALEQSETQAEVPKSRRSRNVA